MKTHRIIIGVVMTLMPLAMLMATPRVILHKPPPGRYGIEDLWKATVGADTECDAWFEGFVFEETHGQVFWAKTKPFPLSRGTRMYQYRDVTVEKTDVAPGYEAFVTRSGHLPAGDYSFRLLLMPFGVGDSFGFVVKPMGPPRLISPRNGDAIKVKYPQFVWTPPMPRPTGVVTYELKLVEVMQGQIPEEAMAANPPWFIKRAISTTSLRWPVSARPLMSSFPGSPRLVKGAIVAIDPVVEEDTVPTAAASRADRRQFSSLLSSYAWQVSAFAGGTKIGESEVWSFGIPATGSGSVTPGVVTARDTGPVSYYDSTQLRPYPVQPGYVYGVWFTSPAPNCSLVAIRYFFGDANAHDTVRGFVNRVPHYPNGDSVLTSMGIRVDSLLFTRLPKGQATVVKVNAIPANSTSDFFIGWAASSERQSALWDSVSDSGPSRSYRGQWNGASWDMSALPGNLAVSAVFRGGSPPPDTGGFTIELRWKDRTADLDLYLVSEQDTICWRKPQDSLGYLDRDDTDGYGPEDIRLRMSATRDSLAGIGVHYYGPSDGVNTEARVRVAVRGAGRSYDGDWCELSPSEWWSAGKVNLRTGQVTLNPAGQVESRPDLSIPSK